MKPEAKYLKHGRGARATVLFIAFVAAVAVLIGLVVMLMRERKNEKKSGEPLMVYCAAGLREPVAAIADQYKREFGVEVRTSYGASQAELVTLERAGDGDIYLPADESYIEMARAKGLVDAVIPVAVQRPVLGVRKGNPTGVKSLSE